MSKQEVESVLDGLVRRRGLQAKSRLTEGYDAAYQEEIDDAREELTSARTEEVARMLEQDPIDYLVNELGAYSEDEALKLPFIQIDVDAAADEAIDTDGVGHFLAIYDGDEIEPEGQAWFRVN